MQGGMLETTLLKGFNDTMTILVDTAAQAPQRAFGDASEHDGLDYTTGVMYRHFSSKYTNCRA
jgi:hypothetical protein